MGKTESIDPLKRGQMSFLQELTAVFSDKKTAKLSANQELSPKLPPKVNLKDQVDREKVRGRWEKALSGVRIGAGVTAAALLSPIAIPTLILLAPPLALVGAGIGAIAGKIGKLTLKSPKNVSNIFVAGGIIGGVTGALPLFAAAGVGIVIAGRPKDFLKVIYDHFIPHSSSLNFKKSEEL